MLQELSRSDQQPVISKPADPLLVICHIYRADTAATIRDHNSSFPFWKLSYRKLAGDTALWMEV